MDGLTLLRGVNGGIKTWNSDSSIPGSHRRAILASDLATIPIGFLNKNQAKTRVMGKKTPPPARRLPGLRFHPEQPTTVVGPSARHFSPHLLTLPSPKSNDGFRCFHPGARRQGRPQRQDPQRPQVVRRGRAQRHRPRRCVRPRGE